MKSKAKSKNLKKLHKYVTMSKKLEKLIEVKKSLIKRLNDLETYIFIENIVDTSIIKTKENNQELIIGIK